ncbi:NAD(P)-binding protein [Cylindrobasidium torrendii FP15055 ss-10]|uniref:D-arabinitol 2-dehydrogenase [ribulose-forming] n=1 Tax=Cylindrobasidium torrendii FP15055 ss-10 TaxID=1314674 RepID=A0A0D7BJL8_9AGAR|nr:NAD(P)-binding protein [Cylindrobasidium torrendii FP15055 ss-10]
MPVDRKELESRVLPQMVLSEASNPLTAPLPQLTASNPADRALQRFAVEGAAIVTGGSGFLGIAAVRALLEHGAPGIAIFDMHTSLQTAEPAIADLRTKFTSATIITKTIDVCDEAVVRDAVDESAKEIGQIRHLLCFAGIVGCAPSLEVDIDAWRKVIDVNLTGSWICAQAVARKMVEQQTSGSIVFTASISGHSVNFPQPQVAYNTSKMGIRQLARSLAAEWAHHGIRVNSISPGYMNTILNHGDGLKAAREIWAARNPMGRMGEPEELTGAVILLSSAFAGRYITGIDIVVDGRFSSFLTLQR